ncbi:MAG: histidine phosphatase family protein [Myxococcales bacterium]|nr:histidine phosphatase family protein [Myxococcales bacterium]
MQLILIRHALPERVESVGGTPADPPLSEVGRAQAEKLAAWLADERVDALYVDGELAPKPKTAWSQAR